MIEAMTRNDTAFDGQFYVGVHSTGIYCLPSCKAKLPKLENVAPKETYAIIVGPPVMYKYVIMNLHDMDFSDDHIIVSLERRMKCGVGKCGHCQMDNIYVCQDGPVFYYDDIKHLKEAI